MTIPRFPLPDGQPVDGKVTLSGSTYKHLAKVLRAKPGDPVSFYGRDGYEYPSVIENISKKEVICITGQRIKKGEEPDPKITLFQGLLKRDKMDLLIEKAAELGVYKIIPIITERSEVRLSEGKIDPKLRHWRKIAESATSQSRRVFIPLIEPPISFRKVILSLNPVCPNLFLSENTSRGSLKEAIRKLKSSGGIAIMVGPPGGFSSAEVAEAEGKGLTSVSLKGRILRSETAAISVLSIVQYEFGNL